MYSDNNNIDNDKNGINTVLLLGFGKTGKAVYGFLKKQVQKIFVYDDILTDAEILALNNGADSNRRPVFFNKKDKDIFLNDYCPAVNSCIISPGIERNHDIVLKLKMLNIPIYSEIEFAYNMLRQNEQNNKLNQLNGNSKRAKILAITGTNGKTTTATLCEGAIEKAGLSARTFVGGNLGVPFISGVNDFTDFVLEISSFQLEWAYDFKPDIAVLLNVEDDHLDRYENFDEYRLTKYKLFKNLKYCDVAVLNADDYNSRILKGVVGSRAVLFGFDENRCDAYFKDDAINLRFRDIIGADIKIPLTGVKDKRKFVIYDMLAAACSLALFGVPPEAIGPAFAEYELLKHRVEYIGSIGAVEFYDDSKATNPSAVISALSALNALSGHSVSVPAANKNNIDIALILGGKDKGFDYECLIEPVKNSARVCVLLGETKDIIRETFNGRVGNVELILAEDMEDAVKKSFLYLTRDKNNNKSNNKNNNNGNSGNNSSGGKNAGRAAILLSPASSSFDMFKDYNERGDVFRACYLELKNEN